MHSQGKSDSKKCYHSYIEGGLGDFPLTRCFESQRWLRSVSSSGHRELYGGH
uniref:Uncharacterized protein n=1 Tax=Enterococcus avium TaxID=33945 RepID=A0A346D8W3_ENTAV|nr:hypothetical protein [Enterococcus avium]